MTIYVVRHAKAGQRADWHGDDALRPLSSKGHRQAEMLADRLAALSPTRLLSSPYVRCRQTLEPLAARLGRSVEDDRRLAEGVSFEDPLALVDEVEDGTVLCSHGDVIPDLVRALERRGMDVTGDADWRKASVWLLERSANGSIGHATVWPPPDI